MTPAYAQSSKTSGRSRTTHGMSASVHRGFTLLEVLIAIVVLSIGLLGLAGLQAAGLRNNNSAYMRTMATQQAYDMADRMRANPPGVTAGSYDAITTTIPTSPTCIATGCSPADIAQYDAFEWNTANLNLLPQGAGTVTRTASPAGIDRFTISVAWDDTRSGAANTTFSITIDL